MDESASLGPAQGDPAQQKAGLPVAIDVPFSSSRSRAREESHLVEVGSSAWFISRLLCVVKQRYSHELLQLYDLE